MKNPDADKQFEPFLNRLKQELKDLGLKNQLKVQPTAIVPNECMVVYDQLTKIKTQENEEVGKTEVDELEAQIKLNEILAKQEEKILDNGVSGEFGDDGVFKIDVGTALNVLNDDQKLKQLSDLNQEVKQIKTDTDEFDNLEKKRITLLT